MATVESARPGLLAALNGKYHRAALAAFAVVVVAHWAEHLVQAFQIYGLGWKPHRRVHFRYDNTHPTGGSHHQKIVVIDDAVAFNGGIVRKVVTLAAWSNFTTADYDGADDVMGDTTSLIDEALEEIDYAPK